MKHNLLYRLLWITAATLTALLASCSEPENPDNGKDEPTPPAFKSEIIGTYTPLTTTIEDTDTKVGAFAIEATWKDPENVPAIDLTALGMGPLPLDAVVFPLVNQMAGILYGGGLVELSFNNDGTLDGKYREAEDPMSGIFSQEVFEFFYHDDPEDMAMRNAMRYYTEDNKVYLSISKALLAEIGAEDNFDINVMIDSYLKQYPGLGIVSTTEFFAIPLKYTLDNGLNQLKIYVDKPLMMPYLPLLQSLAELIPEQVPIDEQTMLPAREMVTSLIDAIFNQTEEFSISITLKKL